MRVPEPGEAVRSARSRLWGVRPVLALLALVALPACTSGGGDGTPWPDLPQTQCTAADTWIARGFQYEHFEDAPADALLTATVHRGEVVPLRVTTLWDSDCEGAVVSVTWNSTAPEVATLTATTPLEAHLQGRQEGETVVSAEVVLSDGSRVTAELYAVPQEGSPLLRVYTVRVTR